ncbi:methylenetetrahydrofolate reductase [bacterium]|nr:methylenetetrahydrofolate reductase [candidate division CSSED10-310 bacterium]
MSLKDLWIGRSNPTLSFEFFPPRDEAAAARLWESLPDLVALKPDFMSVTFGAGGSTRDGSRQLVRLLKETSDIEVVAYVAAYGLSPDDLAVVLRDYRELGVESLLCVRGDKPREMIDYTPHPESLSYACDLIAHIRGRYNFDMGVAGYPEGHIEAESIESDLEFLSYKVQLGACYIISQFFYDNKFFFRFVERCRSAGITVPILAGIMPIYNLKLLENLAGFCGATIPGTLQSELAKIPPDDKKTLSEFGVQFAVKQCRDLAAFGIDGLHIYTMNRPRSTKRIVDILRSENVLPSP